MAEYKNWQTGKKIPRHMMVYQDQWVIPEDLDIFMPPDEILASLKDGDVIYTMDGVAYDIFNHKYLDA